MWFEAPSLTAMDIIDDILSAIVKFVGVLGAIGLAFAGLVFLLSWAGSADGTPDLDASAELTTQVVEEQVIPWWVWPVSILAGTPLGGLLLLAIWWKNRWGG